MIFTENLTNQKAELDAKEVAIEKQVSKWM